MITATHSTVGISLGSVCTSRLCSDFVAPLLLQLGSGRYDECSVLELEGSVDDWEREHRTARKRAWRAERLGYRVERIVRSNYVEDVLRVNTSLDERQGRPMSSSYRSRPSSTPDPVWSCNRHGIEPYGVLTGSELVAYAWIYRAGELALVSSILGHGEHLEAGVMYLLLRGVIEGELGRGGYLVYNRHDSGTDGLRFFKERAGFEPREVHWLP